MARILFIAAFVCVVSLSLSTTAAYAAVFERDWLQTSDGLLTYDDVNQREWLDLTETQLFKFPGDTLEERYQAVVDQTLPGGRFAEFTVGTADDVRALAESAGIDTNTRDFQVNMAAADLLISMLGETSSSTTSSNKQASGYVLDLNFPSIRAPFVEFIPAGRDMRTAGFSLTNIQNASRGVWLYRQVPEPSSFAIVTCVLACLVVARRQPILSPS